MNFLKNFRGVSPIHDFHSHLFANENVSGQHHLGKGSLANAVQQRLITNMALLIGRDGCKVIRHGDFKIKTKTKQNKNTKNKHFLKKQTGNQKKKREKTHKLVQIQQVTDTERSDQITGEEEEGA